MNTSPLAHSQRGHYELRFRSLFDEGRGYAFPCDAGGQVDIDRLGEKARLTTSTPVPWSGGSSRRLRFSCSDPRRPADHPPGVTPARTPPRAAARRPLMLESTGMPSAPV